MGKNKNKRIQKQSKMPQLTPSQQQRQDNQQLKQSEGIFQTFNNANENNIDEEPQQPRNQQNAQNIQKIEQIVQVKTKFEFQGGWLYILLNGRCYKIGNRGENMMEVCVIDGSAKINGKVYFELFAIKAESNAIVQVNKNKDSKSESKSKNVIDLTKDNKVKKIKINKNIANILKRIQQNTYINSKKQINHQSLKQNQNLIDFLNDFEVEQNSLIWVNSSEIDVEECPKGKHPWQNLNPSEYIQNGETTLLIGAKNTGKSTFCQYILNIASDSKNSVCILDLDIGRNRTYPGCISLHCLGGSKNNQTISIWIGEYTPLNNIPTYIDAIKQLHKHYKQKYFTYSLIVNTMGYVTGLGELLFLQIYNICKPHIVLALQRPNNLQEYVVRNICRSISGGEYVNRLYFGDQQKNGRTSTKVKKYVNQFSDMKSAPQRFQYLLCLNSLSNFQNLIAMILTQKLRKINTQICLYKMGKQGKISGLDEFQQTQMRVTILGQFWKENLFSAKGVGFSFQNQIYYDPRICKQSDIKVGLISEGIDFQKVFYQINESRMIEIQEQLGTKLPYFTPIFKSLGNKGVRNNPSKKIVSNVLDFTKKKGF